MVSCGAFRANVLSAATARRRRASASGSRTLSAVLRTESNRTTGTRVARNASSRDRQPESTAPSRPAYARLVFHLGTRITAPRERTRTDSRFSQGYPWSVARCHGRRSESITDERARRGSEKQHVGDIVHRIHRLALLAEIHARAGLRAVLVDLQQDVAVPFRRPRQHEDRSRDGERRLEALRGKRGRLVRIAGEPRPTLGVRRRDLPGDATRGCVRGVARRLGEGVAVRGGRGAVQAGAHRVRSEEHTSELQSRLHLVCRLLLEKKKKTRNILLEVVVKKHKLR